MQGVGLNEDWLRVIDSDFVWAKTGEDVLALRLSADSDCLGNNAVVIVQVNPYQKSRCTRHKANKNSCEHKLCPSKGHFHVHD